MQSIGVDTDKLSKGDRRELAKAITLLEDTRVSCLQSIKKLIQIIEIDKNSSIRIAITGTPGSGKSSLIEKLGLYAIEQGKKVAVLAIDPSSPVSGGSILGDKTRMEKLSIQPNAFIRPSPSRGVLGGVNQKTFESILACEFAGFDYIIIETVGVGQSEVEVSNLSDVFVLVTVPHAGDEIQGIKKGIMELADLIVINKCDGELKNLAATAKQQIINAQSLRNKDLQNRPVLFTSATLEEGIHELYEQISSNFKQKNIPSLRQEQKWRWFKRLFLQQLENKIFSNETTLNEINNMRSRILNNHTHVYDEIELFLNRFFKNP